MQALNNLNAKDVARVSSFVTKHPSIAKKGLQAAAYASGDKEMAKKIGQTNTKDIANTASKINKGANFVVENQDTINDINNKMDKYNQNGNNINGGTSPKNKFVNSSAISNSNNSYSPQHSKSMHSTSSSISNPSSGTTKISAPPPLPGRINSGDSHNVQRVNSTSSTTASSITSRSINNNSVVPNTTKFNKPPPPPVPRHRPDLDKMTEVINSSASNSSSSPTSRGVAAPPPLPNRPSSKLKRSGSDSKLFNDNNMVISPTSVTSPIGRNKTISRGNTIPIAYQKSPETRSPLSHNYNTIQTQSFNNDCVREIQQIFNMTIPQDNISRYSNVFIQVAENNVITDSTVKTLWLQSGISKSILAKIWTFVNRKLDGLLEKSEFIVGMYLIDQYLNGYSIDSYFA
ncbi:hypothetical protein BCR32DRAFT_329276 [Anaeromyces robustus]|uniref:EH domain-containing protein n=1 Tax=Anaeromyces robustus TaxID=1754192 RepID=A0A1Y1WT69_9FUNG|nr:hypothetical protein BCR32DRAFT_329276 [Anaeromyces robustus]|eukprot:ORX76642.1 hypothetical protein BCR32DRAFT_329276 [Anaeromyces robustus]